ncbi:uncharacterized protein JCM6883_004667 [Sporobolomyces salmoneus]|uniref:uncharacterized protein n=1 Tax=Sporobolomyces salmoneus TaxID=183962 RepID=UPI00317AF62C
MADQESATPSKRAKTTRHALDITSQRVVAVLNDKAMKQCFPKYQDEFLQNLQGAFVKQFKDAIPPAWEDHTKEFDFLNKLEQFDKICLQAEERRKRREQPSNSYAIAGDGSITIPSATVPILRSATEELRHKRLALAEENAQSYQRISEMSTATNTSEEQIQKILGDFKKVLEDVKKVDEKQINELQEKMLQIIGQDL